MVLSNVEIEYMVGSHKALERGSVVMKTNDRIELSFILSYNDQL
jgi:hypothetical protein